MANILVTGGCGYIGSHTVVELLGDPSCQVTILDNLSNSKRSVLDRIERITYRRPGFVQVDIRDGAALSRALGEIRPDAVIHFAGLKAVGESCQKPLEYYDNNVCGSLRLLEAMREHGVKNIVFSSSATVYGTPANPRIPETEPVKRGNSPMPRPRWTLSGCWRTGTGPTAVSRCASSATSIPWGPTSPASWVRIP